MERSTPWSNGALKLGVRPFGLHAARHTYASLALASGKSVRWTADQIGHASPMLTLETYAHAMREEQADLSFADHGPSAPGPIGPRELASDVAIRRWTRRRRPKTTTAPRLPWIVAAKRRREAATPAVEDVLDERPGVAPHASASARRDPSWGSLPASAAAYDEWPRVKSAGVCPVQRRNAFVKALASEKPSRRATSSIACSWFAR